MRLRFCRRRARAFILKCASAAATNRRAPSSSLACRRARARREQRRCCCCCCDCKRRQRWQRKSRSSCAPRETRNATKSLPRRRRRRPNPSAARYALRIGLSDRDMRRRRRRRQQQQQCAPPPFCVTNCGFREMPAASLVCARLLISQQADAAACRRLLARARSCLFLGFERVDSRRHDGDGNQRGGGVGGGDNAPSTCARLFPAAILQLFPYSRECARRRKVQTARRLRTLAFAAFFFVSVSFVLN